MKNKFMVSLLCICILLTTAGCGEGAEEAYHYYEELIAAAKECITRNDGEESEDYDFSSMIYMYGNQSRMGYLIEDIDDNGTDELIFGENSVDPDSSWDGAIYDIYTVSDGKLVHVLDGWERNRYYFCENGMIANEGAGGAAYFTYTYFTFEGTELHLVEAVIYDEQKDETNPWFYMTQLQSDAENAEPVSEKQAWAIIEKYVYEHPVFTPFVEE
ncbi:MAG: hypothetical protein HDR26_01515 [Lachnospiraceae bacterium]|nr:hypothetical protein [Lachnospiraceae bacterium]